MKRYYLDVITGNGTLRHTIDADGYEYSECGFYRFYIKENKDIRWTETVASYPIHKTIIKRIDEI